MIVVKHEDLREFVLGLPIVVEADVPGFLEFLAGFRDVPLIHQDPGVAFVDVRQQRMVRQRGSGVLDQLLGLGEGGARFGVLVGRIRVRGGAGDPLVQPGFGLQQDRNSGQAPSLAKTAAGFRIVLEEQGMQLAAVDQAPGPQRHRDGALRRYAARAAS